MSKHRLWINKSSKQTEATRQQKDIQSNDRSDVRWVRKNHILRPTLSQTCSQTLLPEWKNGARLVQTTGMHQPCRVRVQAVPGKPESGKGRNYEGSRRPEKADKSVCWEKQKSVADAQREAGMADEAATWERELLLIFLFQSYPRGYGRGQAVLIPAL